MATYRYNPDTDKVHHIANETPQCNFNIMDGDENDFRASTNSQAVEEAKRRFSTNASECGHCR